MFLLLFLLLVVELDGRAAVLGHKQGFGHVGLGWA